MKKKYLFTFIVAMLSFPLITYAECSYERTTELSKIASNVNFSYTYKIKSTKINAIDNLKPSYLHTVSYSVIISNLTKDIYIQDDYFHTIKGSGEKKIKYSSSAIVTYDIYSNDKKCKNEKLTSVTVELPFYNFYSDNEICKDYQMLDVCQRWTKNYITQVEVQKSIKEYNNLLNSSSDKKNQERRSLFSILGEFVNDNKLAIISCISILLILISVWILKKRSRRII